MIYIAEAVQSNTAILLRTPSYIDLLLPLIFYRLILIALLNGVKSG